MAFSRTIIATVLCSAALVAASPVSVYGKIDTNMPFLPTTTEEASTTVWWTPEAVQSQWTSWEAPSVVTTPEAVVSSVVSSSVPYSNPFTIYTSMTNSLGVITGMPAVVTSQPTQAPVATVCSGCASVLSAESSWSSMVASLYSTTTPVAISANVTASASTHSSASSTASASVANFSQSTGAASKSLVFGSSAPFVIIGAIAYLL